MNAGTAIRFERVSVRFGPVWALSDVSLAIPTGSIAALCGPNGAGKSSAIRVVCGLLRPSSGGGEVLGELLAARPAQRRARIGYMAQHTVLYDELTVLENLAFRAAVMGLARHRERAHEALVEHRLDSVRAQRVGLLSGGWRQRVAFCVAQLARPRLLLLDEPTAGLDADARSTLWAELRALAATGVTDGSLLSGVKFKRGSIHTETVVMRSATRTVRWIKTKHGFPGGMPPGGLAG